MLLKQLAEYATNSIKMTELSKNIRKQIEPFHNLFFIIHQTKEAKRNFQNRIYNLEYNTPPRFAQSHAEFSTKRKFWNANGS